MYPELTDVQIEYVASTLRDLLPRPVQVGAAAAAQAHA
jgi:hypothetical protein